MLTSQTLTGAESVDPAPLPTRRLEPAVIKAWILAETIEIACTGALLLVLLWAFNSVDWAGRLILFAGGTLLVAQLINLLLEPRRWKVWRYELRQREVETLQGIIVRRRSLIPLAAVQYVDTTQGPFERLFGIVSLRICTAAKEHRIPGLLPSVAAEIRQQIIALAGIREPE